MNQKTIEQSEAALLHEALARLPRSLSFKVIKAIHGSKVYCDAEVELLLNQQSWFFNVEVKKVHRKATLDNLSPHAAPNTLLVCNPLSTFLADYCEEKGINFVDLAGNARITRDGLTVHISGQKAEQGSKPQVLQKPEMTQGIARFVFGILANETLLNCTYREIAQQTGLSLGMVNKGIKYLEQHNHLLIKNKEKQLWMQESLALKWLSAYRTVLRPKFEGMLVSTKQSWSELALAAPDTWGGEPAASALTQLLLPEQLQLFTFQPFSTLLRQLKAKPNPHGNLWIVPAFWGATLPLNKHARALLSMAELLASEDSRNQEIAELINEKYLHFSAFPKSQL